MQCKSLWVKASSNTMFRPFIPELEEKRRSSGSVRYTKLNKCQWIEQRTNTNFESHVSNQNKNSVIIYSLSCHYKSVWLSFFCGAQNKMGPSVALNPVDFHCKDKNIRMTYIRICCPVIQVLNL